MTVASQLRVRRKKESLTVQSGRLSHYSRSGLVIIQYNKMLQLSSFLIILFMCTAEGGDLQSLLHSDSDCDMLWYFIEFVGSLPVLENSSSSFLGLAE